MQSYYQKKYVFCPKTVKFSLSIEYSLCMSVIFRPKCISILLLLFLFIITPLWTDPVYRITAETYEINGRTRQKTLERVLGSALNNEYTSIGDVNAFVAKRKKQLDNMRLFEEAEVKPIFGVEENGIVPVTIETSITDGTAFLPLPLVFYNSNEGFIAGIIANAPNIWGTLENVTAVGMYSAPPDEEDRLQWSNPNFMVLLNWSGIRIQPVILSVTAMAMKANEKVEDLGVLKNSYSALSFTGTLSGEIPLTDTLSSRASIRYSRSPDHSVNYTNDPSLLAWGPIDSSVRVQTGLIIKAFHWEENFRSGWTAKMCGGYEWINPSLSPIHSSIVGEAELAAFFPVSRRLNPQFRLYGFGRTGKAQLEAGDNIRGIRNGELRGNAGVYLNAGVQILVAAFDSMEIHLLPFADAVYLYTRGAETRKHDTGIAAGGELLVFLKTLKSLPIKLGFAYDLRPRSKNGSGKFHEIDFSFRLTY